MIKAVVFDLDMTLIDFLGMKRKASNAAARAMIRAGLESPVKKLEKELFEFYLKEIESNRIFGHFLKQRKVSSERILAAGINAYIKKKLTCLEPYPGVKRVLSRLRRKGLRLGIITDAPRLKAYKRLDLMGIADYFEFVIGFEDTGRHKPSPLPFRRALKLLKLKPNQIMYVGDSIDRDIKGAKAIGMVTCLAAYGSTKKLPNLADYSIRSIEELPGLI